jgi:hypothetical protein
VTIFTPEFAAELDKPLAADRVVEMRGLSYLEGHDVIRRANELFGYGNWGYEVLVPPFVLEEGASKGGTPYQVWTCSVKLTVRDGFPIVEYGTNTRSGTGSDGLEMAFKGCITDGVKRCLKTYGDQFGLVLYHKQHERMLDRGEDKTPQAQERTSPHPSPSLRDKIDVPLDWKTMLTNAMGERRLTNAQVANGLGIKPATTGEFYALVYALCKDKSMTIDAMLDEMAGETE